MAEATRKPTWQEKMDSGTPLNNLDEVKADADFNLRQRVAEEKARKEFEARKNRGRTAQTDAPAVTDGKKGKN